MKTISTLVSFMLLFSLTVGATDHKSITGKVIDAYTKNTISHASIQLISSKISNVSNSEGSFELKVPMEVNSDSLLISYMGYKPQKLAIKSFNKDITIKLIPSNNDNMPSLGSALYSINVRPDEASILVKMAFEKVKSNYCTKGGQMTAFYRETVKSENSCLSINEAVLNIDKAPYCSGNKDQIGIFKARGNQGNSASDNVSVKLQGGPNSALNIDVVRNPFLGVELANIDDVYKFEFAEPVTMDDKFFFVVEFNQREYVKDSYYRGKIFIELKSLAIARIEFSKNIENQITFSNDFVKSKPSSLKLGVQSANYIVSYKEVNNKWFFDHSCTEVVLNAKSDKKGICNSYVLSSEIAINKMEQGGIKITGANKLKPNEVISERIDNEVDQQFWDSYNIITPEKFLNSAITKLALK